MRKKAGYVASDGRDATLVTDKGEPIPQPGDTVEVDGEIFKVTAFNGQCWDDEQGTLVTQVGVKRIGKSEQESRENERRTRDK